jgi:hypothetical protein
LPRKITCKRVSDKHSLSFSYCNITSNAIDSNLLKLRLIQLRRNVSSCSPLSSPPATATSVLATIRTSLVLSSQNERILRLQGIIQTVSHLCCALFSCHTNSHAKQYLHIAPENFLLLIFLLTPHPLFYYSVLYLFLLYYLSFF